MIQTRVTLEPPANEPRFWRAWLWFPILLSACGVSGPINQELHQQETVIEKNAVLQALQHSDLLVSSASTMLPQAGSGGCPVLSASTCDIACTSSHSHVSLELATPDCSLPTPAEGAEVGLSLKLQELSLAAQAAGDGTTTLAGTGRLNVGANLPIFGPYEAVVNYQMKSSKIDQRTGALVLALTLTYQGGAGSPFSLEINATGTADAIVGSATGPNLNCSLSGPLQTPQVSCH